MMKKDAGAIRQLKRHANGCKVKYYLGKKTQIRTNTLSIV